MILLSDYGVTSYGIGTGFGHFAIATPDVSQSLLPSKELEHLFVPLVNCILCVQLLGIQIG